MKTYYTTMPSPIGELLLTADDVGLTRLYMETARYPAKSREGWELAPAHPVLAATRTQLDEYFAGARTEFDVPLNPAGTPFQQLVWQQLLEIPYGHTTSYGALARKLGKPGASRAVGLANGHNPISIIVPCHRVIGANGSLTGYGGGLERKHTLLAHERGLQTLDLAQCES